MPEQETPLQMWYPAQAAQDSLNTFANILKGALNDLEKRPNGPATGTEYEARFRAAIATRNNSIKIFNASVATQNDQLKTMIDVLYGEPIEGFPKTIADINELKSEQMNAILGLLGVEAFCVAGYQGGDPPELSKPTSASVVARHINGSHHRPHPAGKQDKPARSAIGEADGNTGRPVVVQIGAYCCLPVPDDAPLWPSEGEKIIEDRLRRQLRLAMGLSAKPVEVGVV